MIDEIVGQAKSNQGKRNDLTSGSPDPEVKKGIVPSGSADPNGDGKETNSKLAEFANTGTATVQRMKKVKV
ncbi:hypothetical protein [Pseudolactococcus raffinolactis]|uniref:hypothetical protein n=1 Tax=Pseudolactococcus raffinolactis TaxID=1366 RepID=UPI0011083530|nr:hypothetical protein [Lactococcus raffinolactis]TLQ13077.1 hypothetical protein FEZ46_10010 [Lactococcus raffinolactis]